MAASPNFSPFPFDRVPRVGRRDAAIESAVARWVAARPGGGKLAALVGGQVRARLVGVVERALDPYAAVAEVRLHGRSIRVTGAARPVRALAQRLLGGPVELEAPRPLTVVEHAIFALAVAAAVSDLGIPAEVWPLAAAASAAVGSAAAAGSAAPAGSASGSAAASAAASAAPAPAAAVCVAVELALPLGLAATPMTITAELDADVVLRVPPVRAPHGWCFDLPILVGRCALSTASVAALAVRDVITIEPVLALVVGGGEIGLAAPPGAVEARVASEYVARDMAPVDDAQLEVTVQLGTARLSLRRLGELAIGEVIALGRPLAGPYEVRAAGRVVGQGELVDIDGELGVRIVSIADPEE